MKGRDGASAGLWSPETPFPTSARRGLVCRYDAVGFGSDVHEEPLDAEEAEQLRAGLLGDTSLGAGTSSS